MPHYTVSPDFSSLFFPHLEAQRRTFSPKFDVYETASSYTLEGELPGLEKSNLSIEFTDPVTLVIKGKIEKSSPTTSETPKGGSRTPSPARSFKATVEDDVDEEDSKGKEAEKKGEAVVEKRGEKRKEKEFRTRQWVSERTVGAFERTFTFPAGIEQEGVTAGLEHGVLRIVVPKVAPVSRKIVIS